MHPYVSLSWDQTKLDNQVLSVEGAETPEQRVKGVGYQYRLPDPTKRKDIEYYRDKANNGYLAHTLGDGESPSLFYESDVEAERKREERKKKKNEERKMGGGREFAGEGNRLW